ncbi:RdgB/HAM1 family non-canonical purine NTP pyrophosphatase [uncultured Sutterella sp.]|uniref:RdgB/HAM1 family non-canonical purine NTP pyrophosphatase n=1 Tax=uncultured Sutterella sp. TaxID=286133 RepID=UPI0025DE59CE|nr:RdgB/HAM1 family non-canonical purine NTP pyrophosphatase [uncultured Sutterella sp.]
MTQTTPAADARSLLVLASGNAGKIREFQAMFAALGLTVAGQKQLGVTSCDEPYGTFVENCLAKARHAARETGLPAMADDSGLCVEALQGAPGVHSARFAGEGAGDAANNRLLVEKLAGVADRRAHYTCVLVALRSADDPEPLIAEGFWRGEITDQPKGEGGFGYDPHFYLPEFGRTAAELTAEEKNAVSHRGQALKRMAELMRERWGLTGAEVD